MTNGPKKSDPAEVAEKPTNKAGIRTAAEPVEPRAGAEGNVSQQNTYRTQCRERVSQALERVRKAARARKKERFTALLHHISSDLLRLSFYALKRNAAPGVDGVTWKNYEAALESNLRGLHDRVHRGAYRALPSRRKYIPKPDGRQRPLGIAALEDKILQRAVVAVLNAIYEEDFLGFSYGFRPKRSQHDALDALVVGIQRRKVNWILDADYRSFFDTVSHSWLLRFLKYRIGDERILRLIRKWLKAGVFEEGIVTESEAGTPQGATATPRTQKAISSLKEQLWGGEKGTHCLILVVNGNTVMSHDPFNQDAEGSPAECRSCPVAASNRASRSNASVVTRVRLVRAPSISLLARSLPTRSTDRSSRSHCANHLEASIANRGTAAEIREKQWPDHWSDRSQRIKCISARPKKAWLNRVKIAAHFKFKFLIRLIACSSRSSRGLTRFWCHVASTPSGCA
jgi:retron-type reverse transcriptase